MIGLHWLTSRFPLYCGLLLDTAAASARTVNGTTWRRNAHMTSSNSPAVWLLRKVIPIDPDSSPPSTSRAPPESNVVTSFSSNSSVSSTLAHHSVRSLPLIDSWASSRTFLPMDLPLYWMLYWMPKAATNRNDGSEALIIQLTLHQSSAIAEPSVRRICPTGSSAAANVYRVVGSLNASESSDSTVTVRLGVVPDTDRTCRLAYNRCPAATAPSCSRSEERRVGKEGGCA